MRKIQIKCSDYTAVVYVKMSNVRQTRSSGSLKNDSLGTGLSSDQNNSVSADSDDVRHLIFPC